MEQEDMKAGKHEGEILTGLTRLTGLEQSLSLD
jgi:hypothetical protein